MSETLEVRSQTPRDEVVEIPYPSSENIGKRRYNALQSCETYDYSESLKISRFLHFIDISQIASAKHRHCLNRLNGRTKIGPQSLKCNLQRRYLSWLTKADIIIGQISILHFDRAPQKMETNYSAKPLLPRTTFASYRIMPFQFHA